MEKVLTKDQIAKRLQDYINHYWGNRELSHNGKQDLEFILSHIKSDLVSNPLSSQPAINERFIKPSRNWTEENHGQPITFKHAYVYCEATDEGAIPESELPENDYDGDGQVTAFRHYLYFIAEAQ